LTTAISIDEIDALRREQIFEEIMGDHPGLTAKQIEGAVEHTKVHPKTGQSRPSRGFKRTLRDMAAAGIWDVESGDELLAPRLIP
jgi:hypothetical protein